MSWHILVAGNLNVFLQRLYSCLANGNADEFQKGEHLVKNNCIVDIMQIGFHLSATVRLPPTSINKVGYAAVKHSTFQFNINCVEISKFIFSKFLKLLRSSWNGNNKLRRRFTKFVNINSLRTRLSFYAKNEVNCSNNNSEIFNNSKSRSMGCL